MQDNPFQRRPNVRPTGVSTPAQRPANARPTRGRHTPYINICVAQPLGRLGHASEKSTGTAPNPDGSFPARGHAGFAAPTLPSFRIILKGGRTYG